MTLDEAREHLAEPVVRRSRGVEARGIISSVNSRWVFVRYESNPQPQATRPEHLTLLTGQQEG
jgi:hypothetical protein